jgi:hypothetical protein
MSHPYPHYNYDPSQHHITPPQPRNGYGNAALVLGITGLVFSFIPLIGVIAWPLVILGLILGIIGILIANRGDATNRGAAIAGTACSAFGLLICTLWMVGLIASSPPPPPAPVAPYVPSSATPVPAATLNAAPAGPLTTFNDVETLAVGTDITPGTYTTNGAPGGMLTANCYYEIHSKPEGTFDDLVKNGNIGENARGRVTLKAGQYFSSMGGCEWTKAG